MYCLQDNKAAVKPRPNTIRKNNVSSECADCEHPWDDTMRTNNRTTSLLSRSAILPCLIVVLLSGSLAAQTPLPPDIENTRRPRAEVSRLTPDQRELVRDYVDLLESLHLTINDFTRYLSELHIKELSALTDQLRMTEELLIARSKAVSDP